LHIPSTFLELDAFRSTQKYLFKWRQEMICSRQKISLALFKNKRKYETLFVSSSPPLPHIDSS
ncbi:hypothetical protein EDC94DRAFT_525624, partial [Helicostylum pulchrum]